MGHNHTMTDPERGDYSESRVHGSGDWYDADLSVHEGLQSFPQRWLRQLAVAESSSLPKRERKGISTLLTRNTTVASARLKRAVVSVGLGPSQLSRLAREPIGLQRVVVFPNSDPRRATIVRRRFCSWRESSSRTRVERQTLESRGKAAVVPEEWGFIG